MGSPPSDISDKYIFLCINELLAAGPVFVGTVTSSLSRLIYQVCRRVHLGKRPLSMTRTP
jgi:hypothetical protein